MNVLTSNESSFRGAKLGRLQGVLRSRGQGGALHHHDRGGTSAVAAGLRPLCGWIDAWLDAGGGHRFRHSAASRPRRRAPAGRGRRHPAAMAVGAAVDRRSLDRRRNGHPHRHPHALVGRPGGPAPGDRLRLQRTDRAASLLLSRTGAFRHRVVADAVAAIGDADVGPPRPVVAPGRERAGDGDAVAGSGNAGREPGIAARLARTSRAARRCCRDGSPRSQCRVAGPLPARRSGRSARASSCRRSTSGSMCF